MKDNHEEEFVSLQDIRRFAVKGLYTVLTLGLLLAPLHPHSAQAQDEAARKVKSKWSPVYPDLARKMNISGAVKMKVVVAPNGTIKDAKVVGGHPILVNAAMDAIKKWKFEPASAESTETVEFTFAPQN